MTDTFLGEPCDHMFVVRLTESLKDDLLKAVEKRNRTTEQIVLQALWIYLKGPADADPA